MFVRWIGIKRRLLASAEGFAALEWSIDDKPRSVAADGYSVRLGLLWRTVLGPSLPEVPNQVWSQTLSDADARWDSGGTQCTMPSTAVRAGTPLPFGRYGHGN